MEKETTTLNDLIENPERYFILLKPASETRTDRHTVEISVEGYRDLFCMIMDLLKAAMLALEGMEGRGTGTGQSEMYVCSLLRIIETLIPLEEAELLDLLYQRYLREKAKGKAK